MARVRYGRRNTVAFFKILVRAVWLAALCGRLGWAQEIYERPYLTVDPGMHTAAIKMAAADKAGRFIATGSDDKTIRIWSAADGRLLRTIRVPAGPGHVGKIYAVAMSPDGFTVAAGGWTWTGGPPDSPIYLFDRETGGMTGRIAGDLPDVALNLVFSRDGRYLAVMLGNGEGLRIFDRDKQWSESFRDADYGGAAYGAVFADDGRLSTSAYDGKIRLYDRYFNLAPPKEAPSGRHPRTLAFSPDGNVLAVGYEDRAAVDLLDGYSLERLLGPAVTVQDNGGLNAVAWLSDGRTLAAGGTYRANGLMTQALAWEQAGRGTPRTMPTPCGSTVTYTIRSLLPLPESRLLVATTDPCLYVLDSNGTIVWAHIAPGAEFVNQRSTMAVSADGTVVDFGFEQGDKSPLRFDLRTLTLFSSWPSDSRTQTPKQDGLDVENWNDTRLPTLNGKPIRLETNDLSRSLAIHPDGHRFALGTVFSLRALDDQGKTLWARAVPGETWAVNITVDGRLVVAAHDDGTIRWYRMDDGRELLALQVLGDKKNWVAWTPEGFYGATPGAYGVLRWQVNRGDHAAADTVPVSAIPKLNRPDALPLVLQEMETARALGIADLAAARHDVQVATGAAEAPGARLHILTIGVGEYGDKAKHLHLKFAAKDADDVFNALVSTQGSEFNKFGGLYAKVLPIYLHDQTADKPGIYAAFASMQRNMAQGGGREDLAVVMFSGHGAVIGNRFYLLPYGVDATTPEQVEATGISADEFRAQLEKLAQYGRVLVLLDACHSGAATEDGSALAARSELLRAAISLSNVTVLTSSSGDEFSREDETWQHGAFTKVLLEAFGRDADENHDGIISMSELTAYMSSHLPDLTGKKQHPGIDQRFQSELFVSGL